MFMAIFVRTFRQTRGARRAVPKIRQANIDELQIAINKAGVNHWFSRQALPNRPGEPDASTELLDHRQKFVAKTLELGLADTGNAQQCLMVAGPIGRKGHEGRIRKDNIRRH